MNYVKIIADKTHYSEVIARVSKVKRSLWIDTADIKALYVKIGSQTKPFFAVFAHKNTQLTFKINLARNFSHTSITWNKPQAFQQTRFEIQIGDIPSLVQFL